jgi:DNA-binding NarL/FixJ family response regulator
MRVILADDAALVRQGLARLLEDNGFDVVAELGDADQLLSCVSRLRPDLVVVDIRMPPTHTVEGLIAAIDIKHNHPRVGVMVLSQHLETRYAVQLLSEDAGGVGYLLKERVADISEFADALRRVAGGGSAVDPEIVSRLLERRSRRSPVEPLSPREREVLALLAEGRSNQAIAQHLFINAKTVESHVAAIFTKLGLLPEPADHRRVLAAITHLQAKDHDPNR